MFNDYININFSYNGELGKLQHQSQANLKFAYELMQNSIITHDEYVKIAEAIAEYFRQEIERCLKNSNSYII